MHPRLSLLFVVLATCAAYAQSPLSAPLETSRQTLQQFLFKKPAMAIATPQPQPPAVTPAEKSALAIRELSLQPTVLTPYDRYVGSVRAAIAEIDGSGATMSQACEFLKEAYRFRYEAANPYRATSPEITSLTEAGDCKAKALWLYNRLGDPGALYVIGKIAKGAKANHAWLYWRCDDRWWILDPTNRAEPLAADSVGRERYLPHYSFGPGGAFRHPTTQLFMARGANPRPPIAAQSPAR